MRSILKFGRLIPTIAALSLAGCGGGDDGGGGTNPTARSAAISGIVGAVKNSTAVMKTVVNAAAIGSAVSGTPSVPQLKALNTVTQGTQRLKASKGYSFVNKALMAASPATATSPSLLDEADQTVEGLMDALLQNPTVSGNTTIYHPNSAKICPPDDQSCPDILAHVTVVQQTGASVDSGTLTFKFDTTAPFVLGYAPNEVYFQVNFAEAKKMTDALDVMAGSNASPTLSSASGIVRLTLRKTGAQSAEVIFGVLEAISLITSEGDSISIDKATEAFKLSGNASANTANLHLGFGAIHIKSVSTNVALNTTSTSNVDFNEIKLDLDITQPKSNVVKIAITNLSMTMTEKKDGTLIASTSVKGDEFEATATEVGNVTNVQAKFIKSFDYTNMTPASHIAIAAGTVIDSLPSGNAKVTSGTVTITNGSNTLNVATGSCFSGFDAITTMTCL